MQEFSSNEPQKVLNIISTLNDSTRLEILSLLIQNKEGLTAADISRQIDKKIPSTIYQLEIIQGSGLIYSEMKMVSSIGRTIKHWILPVENYKFLFTVDLNVIINENLLSSDIRKAYLGFLQNRKEKLTVNDISSFNEEILREIVQKNGSKLADKEITRILQLKSEKLLINTFIMNIRSILENINIKEGYSSNFIADMIGVDAQILNKIILEIQNSVDLSYDNERDLIIREN